jgi:arabinose-5-phosphate isomerase
LGRNLWLHVSDVMHRGEYVAWVSPISTLRDVVIAMTERPLGAACVVDADLQLLGLITDGDVRRALQTHEDIRPLRAEHVMTKCPVSVYPEATLKEAAHLMEDRPSQISVLPVLEAASERCLGLIRIHDIHQAELT